MIMEDLYIFLFGLSVLLLSVMIIAGMTFTFCLLMTSYTHHRNKERKKEETADETAGKKQEETADEKRRKRNAEIIKKYMR